jgi:hypothetical protein
MGGVETTVAYMLSIAEIPLLLPNIVENSVECFASSTPDEVESSLRSSC